MVVRQSYSFTISSSSTRYCRLHALSTVYPSTRVGSLSDLNVKLSSVFNALTSFWPPPRQTDAHPPQPMFSIFLYFFMKDLISSKGFLSTLTNDTSWTTVHSALKRKLLRSCQALTVILITRVMSTFPAHGTHRKEWGPAFLRFAKRPSIEFLYEGSNIFFCFPDGMICINHGMHSQDQFLFLNYGRSSMKHPDRLLRGLSRLKHFLRFHRCDGNPDNLTDPCVIHGKTSRRNAVFCPLRSFENNQCHDSIISLQFEQGLLEYRQQQKIE